MIDINKPPARQSRKTQCRPAVCPSGQRLSQKAGPKLDHWPLQRGCSSEARAARHTVQMNMYEEKDQKRKGEYIGADKEAADEALEQVGRSNDGLDIRAIYLFLIVV